MADIEGKLKQPAKPGMYTIKMAHPGKAMFSPMGCEGKMHNTPYVEVDTRTEKVRPREGRNKAMNFDQKEAYMVGGGKFVSINQVPGDNGKYESDPYDHPTVRVARRRNSAAAAQPSYPSSDRHSPPPPSLPPSLPLIAVSRALQNIRCRPATVFRTLYRRSGVVRIEGRVEA